MSPRYRPSDVNSHDIDDVIYDSPLVSVNTDKIAPLPANNEEIYKPEGRPFVPEFPCGQQTLDEMRREGTYEDSNGKNYIVNSDSLRTFSEGLKYDEGKEPLDLIPSGPLFEVARVLAFGAKKYERYNWRKGMAWTRVASASLRHIYKWLNGETIDPETGCNHLAHAAVNLLFLLEYKDTHTEKDDRYKA